MCIMNLRIIVGFDNFLDAFDIYNPLQNFKGIFKSDFKYLEDLYIAFLLFM